MNTFKNVFGKHSVFNYYGYKHLLINLYFYIGAGLKNNELIYISMSPEMYWELINDLKDQGLPTENIIFYSVEEVIKQCGKKNNAGLKMFYNKYKTDAFNQGYKGIRIIGDTSYAVKKSSPEDLLNMEKIISYGTMQYLPYVYMIIMITFIHKTM